MDAGDVLKRAWEAVEAAGLPEPLQLRAFELAVGLLTDKNEEPRDAEEDGYRERGSDKRRRDEPKRQAKVNAGSPLAKISHESGVDADALEEVIYFDDEGAPHVTGPARRLGKNTAEQARTVALLVTAARSLALDETQVESKVVRAECTRLKCFDQSNFGSHTRGAAGLTTVGDGQARTFKLKSGDAGFNALSEAVDRVRGVKTEK